MFKRGLALLCKFEIMTVLLIFVGTAPAYARTDVQDLDPSAPVTASSAERSIRLNLYDGSRTVMPSETRAFIRLRDGKNKELFSGYVVGSTIHFVRLPFYDNFQDNYTVNVDVDGFASAGVVGIKVNKSGVSEVAVMLLPKKRAYDFSEARWLHLKQTRPDLVSLLSAGASDEAEAIRRFETLLTQSPDSAAGLLNITTSLETLLLDEAPLSLLKELTWDETMAPDRVYGYAKRELIDTIIRAAEQGRFGKAQFPALFHKGATRSWRERSFAEANLQITFHEHTLKVIDGEEYVKVEFDIDYYRDGLSHLLLEVLPNAVSTSRTDPDKVYRMRWTASTNADGDFTPPYSVVAQSQDVINNDRLIVERKKGRKVKLLLPWKWTVRR